MNAMGMWPKQLFLPWLEGASGMNGERDRDVVRALKVSPPTPKDVVVSCCPDEWLC